MATWNQLLAINLTGVMLGCQSLEDANKDCAVFLVHEYTCEDLDGWLKQCYLPLFEEVLEQWYLLPAL